MQTWQDSNHRGARFTIVTSGARATVGATGTGLFYTTALGHGRRLTVHRGHGSDPVQMRCSAS
jgi:hypothetical protein